MLQCAQLADHHQRIHLSRLLIGGAAGADDSAAKTGVGWRHMGNDIPHAVAMGAIIFAQADYIIGGRVSVG